MYQNCDMTYQDRILAYLVDRTEPTSPKQISEDLGLDYGAARQAILRMVAKGDVVRVHFGQYLHADSAEAPPPSGDPILALTASAGDGSYLSSHEEIGRLEGSEALSRPGYDVRWIHVVGDSMGTQYRRGSIVPVLWFDVEVDDINTDDVYLVRLEGALMIKRLQRRSGGRIHVISDNERYPTYDVMLGEEDFRILGRVLV